MDKLEERKPLLCRLHLHGWDFAGPAGLGTGCIETCRRCGLTRFNSFLGGYIYEEPTNDRQ